jgi:DNA-binding PadR family transcriptional regulator
MKAAGTEWLPVAEVASREGKPARNAYFITPKGEEIFKGIAERAAKASAGRKK